MASPSRDAIETFISITAAPEAIALQKLEEHGGNLNEAINAHFSEVDRVNMNQGSAPVPREDLMNIDGPVENEPLRPALVDYIGPVIEGVNGNATSHDLEMNGTVVIDDSDNEGMQAVHAVHGARASPDTSFGQHAGPSISPINTTDSNEDLEEEMIRAAIEASRKETEQHGLHGHPKSPAPDDTDLARAVSLSLETAKLERALSGQGAHIGENSSIMEVECAGVDAASRRHGFISAETRTSSQMKSQEISPFVFEDTNNTEAQPSVGESSRHTSSVNAASVDSGQVVYRAPSPQDDMNRIPQHNGHAFTDEWGGISSEEQDEAVMLEAAMFGGIPEGVAFRFGYQPQAMQTGPYQNSVYPQVPRPPSPTLIAQRLLREQQDDEYLASLQVDREKELKAQQEAELQRLEEAAAREAALEKQKIEEEESHRKQLEEEELERKLAAKQASLPPEPSLDNENAVTLLVRMPDGSRRGRRFLKSDKLQFLFDYIDIGKGVKPGSYKLVRPYPRRAFTEEENELSFSELGLTSKQEALFIELI
ncbi:plant UBX domain-containing protein 8 isoform X1 [Canna indica]|uniref:Plant UBX domain-containing protein 8 isoform X1 n=1 Tax=Canna indica TaxID=4628 RepID=A0AAQ3KWR5_9LILI|nr:plant UBX domain-containing protein 8 isoform X1 [Canna indica]